MCGYNAALSALKEHGADLPAGMGAAV
jgi:hypothetical protein